MFILLSALRRTFNRSRDRFGCTQTQLPSVSSCSNASWQTVTGTSSGHEEKQETIALQKAKVPAFIYSREPLTEFILSRSRRVRIHGSLPCSIPLHCVIDSRGRTYTQKKRLRLESFFCKSEARNTKFETNSNEENLNFKISISTLSRFSGFEIRAFSFISSPIPPVLQYHHAQNETQSRLRNNRSQPRIQT